MTVDISPARLRTWAIDDLLPGDVREILVAIADRDEASIPARIELDVAGALQTLQDSPDLCVALFEMVAPIAAADVKAAVAERDEWRERYELLIEDRISRE